MDEDNTIRHISTQRTPAMIFENYGRILKTSKIPIFKLLYSPANEYFENIIRDAAESLDLNAAGYEGFTNASSLQFALTTDNYLAGVQFDDELANITDYPRNFAFALRFPSELRTSTLDLKMTWMTMRLFPEQEMSGPRNRRDEDGGVPVGYLREGFLPLQNAISMAYIKLASGRQESVPKVQMQRYPYPEHVFDLLVSVVILFPITIMFSFIYSCSLLTKNITIEKEKQLKEVMKVMGLKNWIHWMAWLVKALILMGISAILITVVMKIEWAGNAAVLISSSWSALFFFLLIYVFATICFCFMMAVFFSSAEIASGVAVMVFVVMYIPAVFILKSYYQYSLTSKLCWSLLLNTAMAFGFKVILGLEGTGEGLQWSNIFTPVSVDDDLTLGYIILMLLASSCIYMTICLYVEQIFPGDFGVPRQWSFPFTRKFWCGDNEHVSVDDMPPEELAEQRNADAFESEPSGKHIGLQVRNLKKRFGTEMVVKGLSMNMYEDEITVLLGHNGAGKTTTISMLTGMFPPTGGTAIINGSDIRSNLGGARSSLGICPQHNVLFDDMTVANHLVFFSRLKGLKGEAVRREVNKYLKIIMLEDKAAVVSSKLSGGTKRKLSVCCALCGNTKVVLCDEPSSGMDPSARRQLWDLLQAEKIGRTVLLTTHSMDEADVIGDRIAIMCDGELKCHGTSFFLKKKYGSGYHLICVKRENCDVAKVTRLLNGYIPDMKPESEIGTELSYQLPESYSTQFEKMFSALEDSSDELMLDGYGVRISSMEEVFMNVGAENANSGSRKEQSANMNDAESIQSDHMFPENARLLKGSNLCLNQWYAMFLKKFLYTFRNKLLFVVQNVKPILDVIFMMILARTWVMSQELRPITFSLRQYPEAVTVLQSGGANNEVNSLEANIAEQYRQICSSYGAHYEFQSSDANSFENHILELGKSIQVKINSRYLAAATIEPGKMIAWLNNQPLHTAPLTINLLHNAMARAILGTDAEISVTNAPLPFTTDTLLKQQNTLNLGTVLAIILCYCMGFVSSFYIIFLIKERESRSKLLQFVGGVNVWTFWLTQLLWDLVTHMFSVLIVVVTLACFQEVCLSTFAELARYFLVLFLFGFSVLPFIYLISFYFTEPATGFGVISNINIYVGVFPFIVVLVLSMDLYDAKDTNDNLQWILRVFPQFSMTMAIYKLYTNDSTRKACSIEAIAILPDALRCQLMPKCCTATPYFAWKVPGILPETLYMTITAAIFFIIIMVREYGIVSEIISKLKKYLTKPTPPPEDGYVDDDVELEKQGILDMSDDMRASHNLVLDRVTKYYKNFLAVNQISLCVKQTECFGLLGINGAGKTAIFKMMTGDERITYGSVYIRGMNLAMDMNRIYNEIGYCPQFDALLDDLTGYETLKIFFLLRGVRRDRINQISEELAKSFGFIKYLDKKTKAYSGGNKRKLSAAIAVIGSPSVIFLDEPTTGMDPASRRQLWNIVCRIRDSGKSIVLTTHSMEECEALCTRLAIMVNGEFKCIGSSQHLKNKFSKGLILKMKVRRNMELLKRASKINDTLSDDERSVTAQMVDQDIQSVKNFVDREFPHAILQAEYQGILTFYIPLSSIKWSRIFGLIERNRDELNVEDYSISQTTIEEIFLEFAKYQRGDQRSLY